MQLIHPIPFATATAPAEPPSAGTVDLWFVDLRLPNETIRCFRDTLAPDEIERAERFHFEVHRGRYIARRGALRVLLGHYLGVEPTAVEFCYGDHEKPSLAPSLARRSANENGPLQFNLSDSEDYALIGFGHGDEIGVDIEVVRDMPDAESIASHFFSLGERRELSSLPAGDCRSLGFFHCWTRKEAYLKAIGKGLAAPLDAFRVTLHPEDPARFVAFDGLPGEPERWSLVHLEPEPGVVGALAVRRPGIEGRGFVWRP